MGFFGSFNFDGQHWTTSDESQASGPAVTAPHLCIDVYDSDFATVTYHPAVDGQGLCYLGFQPRDYFESQNESDDVDLDAEALGLATWAVRHAGVSPDVAAVRGLLAEEEVEEPVDVFVEATVARLCIALGLPGPPGITA